MNTGKKMNVCGLTLLDRSFVIVSLKLAVGMETIGDHCAARLNALSDKPVKSCASRIWNTTQANAPNPRSVALGRHRDEAFAVSQSPNSSMAFRCAPSRFRQLLRCRSASLCRVATWQGAFCEAYSKQSCSCPTPDPAARSRHSVRFFVQP